MTDGFEERLAQARATVDAQEREKRLAAEQELVAAAQRVEAARVASAAASALRDELDKAVCEFLRVAPTPNAQQFDRAKPRAKKLAETHRHGEEFAVHDDVETLGGFSELYEGGGPLGTKVAFLGWTGSTVVGMGIKISAQRHVTFYSGRESWTADELIREGIVSSWFPSDRGDGLVDFRVDEVIEASLDLIARSIAAIEASRGL